MSETAKSSLDLGPFELAVFDLLQGHRDRHPEAQPGELAMRLATMAAAVLVSGVDPLRIPDAVVRVQAWLASQVDELVIEEADPLGGLFDAMARDCTFFGLDLSRQEDVTVEAVVMAGPGDDRKVLSFRRVPCNRQRGGANEN